VPDDGYYCLCATAASIKLSRYALSECGSVRWHA